MNLDGMNTKQLRHLRDRIDETIAAKQEAARIQLRDRFALLAAESGLDLSDVVGRPAKKKRMGKRWRDQKTGAIWSGIGRTPRNFDRKRAVPL